MARLSPRRDSVVLSCLSVSGIALLTAFSGQSALAVCAPDPAAPGSALACAGTDADGFATTEQLGSITVVAGASVSVPDGSGGAVNPGEAAPYVIDGVSVDRVLTGSGVIEVNDGSPPFGNITVPAAIANDPARLSAFLDSLDDLRDLEVGVTGSVVINGQISAGANPGVDGIFIEGDIGGALRNNGSITGENGVRAGRAGQGVSNTGSITATADGVNIGVIGGDLTNTASGTVTAGQDGFEFSVVSGDLTNAGAVTSGGDAFSGGSVQGSVSSTGTVEAGAAGFTLSRVDGAFGNAAGASIVAGTQGVAATRIGTAGGTGGFTNAGEIRTTQNVPATPFQGSFGLDFERGPAAVEIMQLNGNFRNERGATILGATNGVEIGRLNGSFFNGGRIESAGDGDNPDDEGFFSVDGTVHLGDVTGDFTNARDATILGGEDGVFIESLSGTFRNAGTIRAENDMSDAPSNAIFISDRIGGDFINTETGVIDGTDSSFQMGAGGIEVAGQFRNDGQIDGDIQIEELGGDFGNTGTITGTDFALDPAVGIAVAGGDIQNDGTIASPAFAPISEMGINIADTRAAIAVGEMAGDIANNGSISAGGFGLQLQAMSGSIANAGTIDGDAEGTGDGAGIVIVNPAGMASTFINRAGATVTGGIGFSSDTPSAQALFPDFDFQTFVDELNAAEPDPDFHLTFEELDRAFAGRGNETVFNSGDIIGTGGTAVALGPGNDRLVHNAATGSIQGRADGGAGTDRFELTAGSYDLTNNTAFETTVIQSGATGTGTGSVDGSLIVRGGGILAPGPALGTLEFSDDATFATGSFFSVDANAAGDTDFLEIGGSATINGGTLQISTMGDFVSPVTISLIRAAGGLTGMFDSVSLDDDNLSSELRYDGVSAFLTISPAMTGGGDNGGGDNGGGDNGGGNNGGGDNGGGMNNGVLNVETVEREVRRTDVARVEVTRQVARRIVLPTGDSVTLELNADGSTSLTSNIGGTVRTATTQETLAGLSAGNVPDGIAAPGIDVDPADLDGQPGRVTVATSTVTRDDGETSTVSRSVSVTEEPGTVSTGMPTATTCGDIAVTSGQVNCTITETTTITERSTVVTFSDEAVIETGEVRALIEAFAAFPEIVADLQTLLPDELPLANLTRNQREVAETLNAIARMPGFTGSPLEPIFDEIAALPAAQQRAALDQLHPEPYDALTVAGLDATSRFHRTIREHVRTRARDARRAATPGVAATSMNALAIGQSTNVLHRGRGTVWGAITGTSAERDGGPANIDVESASYSIQAGTDYAFGDGAIAGISAAYTHADIDVDSRADGEAEVFSVGLYSGIERHGITLQGGLGYSHVSAELDRRIGFGGFSATPSGEMDWSQVSAYGEVSTELAAGPVVLRPFVGIEAIGYSGETLRETGGGGAGLTVTREDDVRVTGLVGVEVGAEVAAAPGWTLAPTLGVGARHHFAGEDRVLSASFLGAPAGAPGFTATAQNEATALDVSLDLKAQSIGGTSVSLGYDGSFADDEEAHAGTVRVSIPF